MGSAMGFLHAWNAQLLAGFLPTERPFSQDFKSLEHALMGLVISDWTAELFGAS